MLTKFAMLLGLLVATSASKNGNEFSCLVVVNAHRVESGSPFSYHCDLDSSHSHPDGVEGYSYELLLDKKHIDEFHHEFAMGYKRMVLSSNDAVEIVGNTLRLKEEPRFETDHSRRQLLVSNSNRVGTKTVLVIRIQAKDSSSSQTAAVLAQRVFTDGHNLKSQTAKCSKNKLNFVPATGTGVVGGVLSVTITQSVAGLDGGTIAGYATTVAQTKLGVTSLSKFNHVMFMIPPAAKSFTAFANVNSWRSVYSDGWSQTMSGAMHEVGHNLGLSHAGIGSNEYSDTTGYMGYSSTSQDKPFRCYDAAHSVQLGWYSDKVVTYNPATAANGITTFKLYGIADYMAYNPSGYHVIVQIPLPAAGYGLYINYNRATGYNVDASNPNMVCIVKMKDTYANSNLNAKLNPSNTYVFSGGTNIKITVTFTSKATAGFEYAVVTVKKEAGNVPAAAELLEAVAPGPGEAPDGFDCESNASCDDGDMCNGNETCSDKKCVAGTKPDPLPADCQVGECDSDASCDDSDECNGKETCSAAKKCVAGTTPNPLPAACKPDLSAGARSAPGVLLLALAAALY